MGRYELEVKKERFKRFCQGLYLQKIKLGIFFKSASKTATCIKIDNCHKKDHLRFWTAKKNKESVGDLEEGEDEEDDGNNSHENKVVDESTTQHNHLNVFEKKGEIFGLF